MTPKWMTVREVRDTLRFPSDDACRVWLRRQGIASVKRGRIILVSPVDVAAALRPALQPVHARAHVGHGLNQLQHHARESR